MYHPIPNWRHRSGNLIPGIILCGVWLAGLSLGLRADCFYGDALEPLLLTAGAMTPHFPDVCMVTMTSLLLTALAVFFFHRTGAYLAAFLRGLFLGSFLGILAAQGGIWLAALLPFSGLCFSPMLLWYLWRRLDGHSHSALLDALCCAIAGLALAAVDTWVVAPFLAAALTI